MVKTQALQGKALQTEASTSVLRNKIARSSNRMAASKNEQMAILQQQSLIDVSIQLRSLFDSSSFEDYEAEIDLMEQSMLLKCLLEDKKSLDNLNATRDHRLRYPFLYSASSSYEPKSRESRTSLMRPTTKAGQEEAASDNGAVAREIDSTAGIRNLNSNETKDSDNWTQNNQGNLGAVLARGAPVDAARQATSASPEQPTSSVFNLDSLEPNSQRGTKLGSYLSDNSIETRSMMQITKAAKPISRNLIVWHRHTEMPFDISSSEFTVKTPVLPLLQGGHLVFLTSRSGSRTAHYSVKIIKKSMYNQSGKPYKYRGSMEHVQMAIISKDEFLVLKKLAHPCVANLLYFCENEFQYYYFFPHYMFANLSGPLSLFNRLGPNPCVYVICCIINAVEYLYRNCIIHRDISSKSILFTVEGRPVLFHFDYATFYGSLYSPQAKPNYLPDLSTRAPEVISPAMHCEPDMYPNCDVWGLGVLMGELLMGNKVMMRALKRKLDLHWVFSVRESEGVGSALGYSGVPKELLELVRSCLRKQAQDRPSIHSLMLNSVFAQFGVANMLLVIRQKAPIERMFNGL